MKKDYNNIEFWKPIYEEYINGRSINDLTDDYKIKFETIKKYFLKFDFSLKTKEQIKQESIKKREKTCLKKYGNTTNLMTKETKEKIKKTNLEKYGVENVSQNEKIKEKKRKTNVRKFGTENVFQNEKIKEKIKETNLQKYGEIHHLKNKEIKEKMKKTNMKKYGVKYSFQNEKIKNKIIQTNLNKYGVEFPLLSKKIREKIELTLMGKYGVRNVLQSKEIRESIKKTNLEKYGVENVSRNEKIKEKIKKININNHFNLLLQKIKNEYEFLDDYRGVYNNGKWILYKFKCLKCNNIFETPLYLWQPKCSICYPPLSGKSKLEDEIETFINSLGFKTQRNIKVLDRKEIDIFIPEKQIGIEINGVYYHNSNPESHSYKDRNYHKMKTDLAREKNIKLIHVWDCFNLEVYKSMIRNLLGKTENKIYARKCEVRRITKKEEIDFLNNNHIHRYVKSIMSLGLFYQNELVSVISFRKHKEGTEIARFASKINTNVIGGFSKLLKHSNINETLITYCDIEFCPFMEDSVYYKNGFTFVKETSPKLYFTDFKNLYSRQEFMKYKLKDKLEKYDENLTAEENLMLNHIYPIYSTGNWKFIKKRFK